MFNLTIHFYEINFSALIGYGLASFWTIKYSDITPGLSNFNIWPSIPKYRDILPY